VFSFPLKDLRPTVPASSVATNERHGRFLIDLPFVTYALLSTRRMFVFESAAAGRTSSPPAKSSYVMIGMG
jgi:hypothetical protein